MITNINRSVVFIVLFFHVYIKPSPLAPSKNTEITSLKSVFSLPSTNNPLGIPATETSLSTLGQSLKMPEVSQHGQVPVLNLGGGYAIVSLDHISQSFVEYCKTKNGTILDIGAGYGTISVAVLQETKCSVIANDIGAENLLVLRSETSPENYNRLFLNNNRFPQTLDLPDQSLDGVAIVQVFHFLTGEEIEAGLQKIMRWLKPGGKLFIVTCSPYVKVLTNFMDTYEARKTSGMPWPGLIENWAQMRPHMKNLPSFFHVLDHQTLCLALTNAGFIIENMSFVDRRQTIPSLGLDGRESIGVIASKPLKKL